MSPSARLLLAALLLAAAAATIAAPVLSHHEAHEAREAREGRGGEGAERLPLPSSQELQAIKKVAQILVMLGEQVIPAILGEQRAADCEPPALPVASLVAPLDTSSIR